MSGKHMNGELIEVGTPQAPQRRLSRAQRHAGVAYLFVLPALVIFGVFVFYPLVKTAYLGFFTTPPAPTLPSHYVGLTQYRSVLASSDFRESLWRTVQFVLYTVPAGIVLGIALAMLANQRLPGIRIFRTIYSSTVATSMAVAAVIFFTLLNPQVGLLSYWLGHKGGNGILQSTSLALPAVSVVTIWQNIGLTFILMSAALQSVPEDLLEAARVDGASSWLRFRAVTIPLLSPMIFFAAIVGVIGGFQAFGQIDILTQGGPNNHTLVLIYDIYQQAFKYDNTGYAAVLSVALFVILLVLTFAQFWYFQRRVFYAR
ncbi:MAG: sugar ABC transporter permease [Acidimicrobiales bacterium]